MNDFDKAFEIVIGHEGGYVNHPSDPGGETKYGISKRAYPNEDIRNLTLDRAKQLYFRDYWQKSGASNFAWPMSYYVFDLAVNSGVGRAQELLAKSNGPAEFLANRIRFFAGLKDQLWDAFGRGWMRRMASLVAMLPNTVANAASASSDSPRLVFLNGEQLNVTKASVVGDKWYINTKEK